MEEEEDFFPSVLSSWRSKEHEGREREREREREQRELRD
jgi:hypothetical protein